MRVCNTCVLDENFPGISFNEQGICNHCIVSSRKTGDHERRARNEEKFKTILDAVRGKASHDCVLAYSGGKDSTYTLHLLRKKYGMNVLAVTFDNGFQSMEAQENIRKVLENLDVDHIRVTPRFDLLRSLFNLAVRDPVFSQKALERASAACTGCLGMIRFSCFRLALEREIPIVILGLSPGQAPASTAIFKTNSTMIRTMQDAIYLPLIEKIGEGIRPYFLEDRHFEKSSGFPYSVNPLAFLQYDEETIYRTIREYGWEKPQNTDSNSTNCLINSYAIQEHLNCYHFHPYAFEIAGLVRGGVMTREEGLKRLATPPNPAVLEYVKKRLSVSDKDSR